MIALWLAHPIITLLAIVIIRARQHALTVIAHDASHFRLLQSKKLNDWIGDLFTAWPVFISVATFRYVHSTHHRYINQEGDRNRRTWLTHTTKGKLRTEWTFPQSTPKITLHLLAKSTGLFGILWIVRGLLAPFVLRQPISVLFIRSSYYILIALVLSYTGSWWSFFLYWILPLCTWHIFVQHLRLMFEHSNIHSSIEAYRQTRSTTPGWLGRLLFLPRNIGYHIEHHWYPSVPFYNLPALRQELIKQQGFQKFAVMSHSITESFRQLLQSAH